MINYKRSQRLKTLYACLFALCFSLAASFTLFLCVEFDIWGLIATIVLYFGTGWFIFMMNLENQYKKLKYYFLGKDFEAKVAESSKKFVGANQEFLDDFKNSRKRYFQQTGEIFEEEDVAHSAWVYRNEKELEMVEKLFSILLKSIKSKGGFTEFCRELRKFNVEDEYKILTYLHTGLASNELKFLFSETFAASYFWVEDTGISAEYSEENKKTIKKLDEMYSPILFGFEDEIKAILKRIKDNKK